MINVVYLVLVFSGYGNNSSGGAVAIPQANMAQCQVNAKNYNDLDVKKAYCIVGVK